VNDVPYHDMLDDVAVYALGALPPADAARVRDHLKTCAECRAEYAALAPAAALVGEIAEAPAGEGPSALLKPRIMRVVRESAAPSAPAPDRRAPARTPVWPAYLVAAACFVIALISSISNITLSGQLREVRSEMARVAQRSSSLASNLDSERSTLSEIMSADAKHYSGTDGEVIVNGRRLYVAMHDLAALPHGKVYQAWTMPKGGKAVVPSLTFVPDSRGVAVISLPVDAQTTGLVAISVEPDGGSKQPTTKPILAVPLT
jgi:anti-sigma-K factor RskA